MAKVRKAKQIPQLERTNHTIAGQAKFVPGRTLREMIANGFVLPTVELRPREDGRPWSEIEGFEE
jgi:hypothetical protein